MELVDFLRARLDEDEAAARGAAHAECADTWTTLPDSYGGILDATGNRSLAVGYGDVMAPETAIHIARHDPARVLAEVEAKRRILDDVLPTMRADEIRIAGEWGVGSDPVREASDDLLSLLALPYRDHPDFDPAWLED